MDRTPFRLAALLLLASPPLSAVPEAAPLVYSISGLDNGLKIVSVHRPGSGVAAFAAVVRPARGTKSSRGRRGWPAC